MDNNLVPGLTEQIKHLEDDINTIKENNKFLFEKLDKVLGDRIELRAENYKLKEQIIKTKQNQTTILNKHDWFETNATCKKCSFLTGAFVAKKELQEDIIELNNVQSNIKEAYAWFELYPNFAVREKKFDDAKRNKQDMENSIEKLDVVSESLGMRLELEDNKLGAFIKEREVYIQNEDSIIHNDKVKEKITIVDEEIYKIEENTRKNNDEILKNNTFLGQIIQRITDLGGNIEMLKEIEKKYNLHEFLMDAFSNDGIPLMIMNKAVPLINKEIKKVLSNITNFEVFLEVDTEAHDLMIFIDDGTSRRRVELGSGMEKTLAALTIRAALCNISLLPTCNLFVIDEGFGTLDSENINHMNQLLGYLKSKFENVLIISHIESMQDFTDNVININKNEKGYSSIKIL